jgi:signal peptidase
VFKKIINLIEILLVVFLVFVAGSLVLGNFRTPIQYRLFSVQSGSMRPTIPLGSIIVVWPQKDYQKDDIITFGSEANLKNTVTHRVVEVSKDNDLGTVNYRTKGDANNAPDTELIRSGRVVGKVVVHIPYLGYPVTFAQTQVGLIVLVIIPATLIVYSEISSIKNELASMFKSKKAAKKEPDLVKAEKPKKQKKS